MKVNFSDRRENYYIGWRNTTKADSLAVHSTNYPDLQNIGATITTNARTAFRASRVANCGDGWEEKQAEENTYSV